MADGASSSSSSLLKQPLLAAGTRADADVVYGLRASDLIDWLIG